jgi:hypothetical protein
MGEGIMEHPFAITLDVGTSLINHTGSWRTLRPEYVHRLPPCNHACPAGEDIQGWLAYAENGDYEAAWRSLTENNPLPGVMGRVCYHPCEGACNRAVLDSAVGINSVERFLGDLAIKNGWRFAAPATASGKKVLIVGAGPSGANRAGSSIVALKASAVIGPTSGTVMNRRTWASRRTSFITLRSSSLTCCSTELRASSNGLIAAISSGRPRSTPRLAGRRH